MSAAARMVHVASPWRLRRGQVEDEWVAASDPATLNLPFFMDYALGAF
jgi:hypothetical protein